MRKKCQISNSSLRELYTFKKFPIYMGCTDQDLKNDIFEDMIFCISKNGIIQLKNLLPLNILYKNFHYPGTEGPTWENHNIKFSKIILKNKPFNVLEIGGGSGKLAKICLDKNDKLKWTILEPKEEEINGVKVVKNFFDENFIFEEDYDTIIHSHFLEHLYDPNLIFKKISEQCKIGTKHIFSLPNFDFWIKNKFYNTLNFEHTILLSEEIVKFLLNSNGFKIIEIKKYKNHSIFYSVILEKKEINYKKKIKADKKQIKNFKNWISDIENVVKKINDSKENVYLFGAHVSSQIILNNPRLEIKKIIGILDNSKNKQGKRLYGFNFKILAPEEVKEMKNISIVLKNGPYNKEIKKQMIFLNKNIKFIE